MGDRDYFRASPGAGFGGPRLPFWSTIPGTKGILIALVGIHLVRQIIRAAAPDVARAIDAALELHPEEVLRRGYVWQLLTASLLHARGFWHLLINGLSIFFFGRLVEDRLGLKRYVIFCLFAALAASFGYLLFAVVQDTVNPMLGASGVAMGLIALAALWHPQLTVIFIIFPMPLWVLAVLLVALDLLNMFSIDSNIAHAAHLAGALYGWIYYRYQGRIEGVLSAIDRYSERQKRRKARSRKLEEEELRAEVDRILDKVNREGLQSLSDAERRFLNDASARLRR